LRNINGILQLTSFLATVLVLVLLLHCVGTGQDLLAVYWGAAAVFAIRFCLVTPEPDQ
jgi:hypothetical protein